MEHPGEDSDLARKFRSAQKAAERQDYPRARRLLKEIVRRQPDYQYGEQSALEFLREVRQLQRHGKLRSKKVSLPAWGWAVIGVAGGLVLVALIVSYLRYTHSGAANLSSLGASVPVQPTHRPTALTPGAPEIATPASSVSETTQAGPAPVQASQASATLAVAGCSQVGQTWFSPRDGMTMVCVPAGPFLMGSDKSKDPDTQTNELPQHTVTLKAYWIDQTEVTNAMFGRFIDETGYRTDAERNGDGWVLDLEQQTWLRRAGATWKQPRGAGSSISGMENYPVVQVSWFDGRAYCAWAGKRLPSEAEWEKAARGTDGRIYPWGNSSPAGDLLNLADSSLQVKWSETGINDGYKFAAPVGSYPAGKSVYGALDMAGNVWEWVADWYSETYYADSPQENPPGSFSGIIRGARGGAWSDGHVSARTTDRDAYLPNATLEVYGIRCAVDAP